MYYRVEDFRVKTNAALILAGAMTVLLGFAMLIG